MENRKYIIPAAVGGLIILFLIIFGSSMFYTVGNGERAVIFERFGNGMDVDRVYGEGFHTKAPWNILYTEDVRISEIEEQIAAISSNGLNFRVDVSIRYNPIPDKIGYLINQFQRNYVDGVIIPQVRSTTREVFSAYTPEEIYSTKREQIQKEIEVRTSESLAERYINLDALLIRDIELPSSIKEAIENKLAEEQALERDEFRLQRESKEAERKQIEAEGIRKFDSIVAEGISTELLRWKGIQATRDLAESPNSKVVIIGSGEDGLPIILGGQ